VSSNAVAELVVAIRRMLRRRGAWAVETGEGAPRLLSCYGGRFLAIEVKAPRGPGPTQTQRLQLEALDRAGAITLVARSVCEVEAVLDDLDRNPPEMLAIERMIA
jgi:hypothetical protein